MARAFAAVAVVLTLVLGLVLTLRGDDESKDKKKFAYVDLKKAIDGYRRTIRLENDINAWREKKEAEIAGMRARMKDLEREVRDAKPMSNRFMEASRV